MIEKLKELLEQFELQKRIVEGIIDEIEGDLEIDDRWITPALLSDILGIKRATINLWITKKIITDIRQERKNCKIEISYSNITNAMNHELIKYQDSWFKFING